MLEPVRVTSPLWYSPRPEDQPGLTRDAATLEVMRLLAEQWLRNLPNCEIDEYEPNRVRHYLRNFPELISATEGMSAAGAEPIGSAGEVDARRDQNAIKADIEDGTDRALADILHWRQVARIYKRQERFAVYLDKRSRFNARDPKLIKEPADQAIAESVCIDRVSRALGWYPHECDG